MQDGASNDIEAGVGTGGSTDFASAYSDIDSSLLVLALIGAGAILAVVIFVRWAAKRVGKFFDGDKPESALKDARGNSSQDATQRGMDHVRRQWEKNK